MKEIVVIPKDDLVYIKPKYNKMERYIKVPETWEELKDLCEGIKGVEVFTGYISCNKLLFWSNGEISSETDDGEEIVYIENRTPAQMYQIIKSLIGEE